MVAKSERHAYLFLDCITLRLRIDVKSIRKTNINGVRCHIDWYSEGTDDEVKKLSGEYQDFIVIDKGHQKLELLMVRDVVSKDQTKVVRVAACTLKSPDKVVLNKLRGEDTDMNRLFTQLSLISDYLNYLVGIAMALY